MNIHWRPHLPVPRVPFRLAAAMIAVEADRLGLKCEFERGHVRDPLFVARWALVATLHVRKGATE